MASATFRVPPALRAFPRAVELSVIDAQTIVGSEVEAHAIENAPAHTGALRQSLKWLVTTQPSRVLGRLVAANPQTAVYADVMDKGRRPMQRGPGSRHLRRWVELKLPDRVREVAADISASRLRMAKRRAEALARRASAPKGKRYRKLAPLKTNRRSPNEEALDRVSYLISRAIHRKGIKGRRYVPPLVVVGRSMVREIGRQFARRVAATREIGATP